MQAFKLEFKVKAFLYENFSIDQIAELNDAAQALLLTIFLIFRKNSRFNAIRIKFCPFLELFQRTILLTFGSQLKN